MKKKTWIPLAIVIATCLAIVILIRVFDPAVTTWSDALVQSPVLISGVFATYLGGILSVWVVKFLKTEPSKDTDESMLSSEIKSLQKELSGLIERVEPLAKLTLADGGTVDIKELQESIGRRAFESLQKEVIEKLKSEYEESKRAETLYKEIDRALQPIEKNLEHYVVRLRNNSIINLLIGIGATVIAIVVLLIILFSNKQHNEMSAYLMYFVPRITFVISIQLFAFFFLRLYRNNLEDSKYFQNELTNIYAKTSSIRIAKKLQKDKLIDKQLLLLMEIERNFKLGSGESLLTLERAKIESEFDAKIVDAVEEIIKTRGPRKPDA